MKKVLVFGTFDIFHKGHEFFLKQAKEHGDVLEVVIARDSTVKQVKGKYPTNKQSERLNAIQNLNYVNQAYLGNKGDKYNIIKQLKPDIICLGYDQDSFTKNLKEILNKRGLNPEIITLKSYKSKIYKSSKLLSLS